MNIFKKKKAKYLKLNYSENVTKDYKITLLYKPLLYEFTQLILDKDNTILRNSYNKNNTCYSFINNTLLNTLKENKSDILNFSIYIYQIELKDDTLIKDLLYNYINEFNKFNIQIIRLNDYKFIFSGSYKSFKNFSKNILTVYIKENAIVYDLISQFERDVDSSDVRTTESEIKFNRLKQELDEIINQESNIFIIETYECMKNSTDRQILFMIRNQEIIDVIVYNSYNKYIKFYKDDIYIILMNWIDLYEIILDLIINKKINDEIIEELRKKLIEDHYQDLTDLDNSQKLIHANLNELLKKLTHLDKDESEEDMDEEENNSQYYKDIDEIL